MTAPAVTPFRFQIRKNCGWAQPLFFCYADGTPFDLSTVTINGQIRDGEAYTPTPRAWLAFTVAVPASGLCTVALSAHDTGTLPDSFAPLIGEINGIPHTDPKNPLCLGKGHVEVLAGGNTVVDEADAPTVPLEVISLVVGAASPATTRALLQLSPPHVAYLVLVS